MNNKILTSQHVLVAGMNGSGKTFLAETYLAGYENVIALDTKGMLEWNQAGEIEIYEHLDDLIKFHTGKGKAIYRPTWQEMNNDYYNGYFEWIYKRRNTTAYIDELMSIYENASQPLPFHKAILTRGRQLNTNVWQLTQRPKTIPLVCLSECYHFFTFDLNLETDRKRIYEVIEQKDILTKPTKVGGKHSFWYYNIEMDKPTLAKLKHK